MGSITWIRLDGAANVRDIGGHSTLDGGTVRHGEVFRGDSPHRLTMRDVAVLEALGLRSTLDLRRPDEIAWLGDGPIAEVVEVTSRLPLDLEALEGDSLFDRYRRFVEERSASLAEGVRFLANPAHRPTLVHCFAGKDRTGVLVALTLGLLGVAPEEIVADYRATDEVTPEFLSLAATELAEIYQLSSSSALVRADGDAMERLVTWILEAHGSFEDWARTAALGDEEIEHLREELVLHDQPLVCPPPQVYRVPEGS